MLQHDGDLARGLKTHCATCKCDDDDGNNDVCKMAATHANDIILCIRRDKVGVGTNNTKGKLELHFTSITSVASVECGFVREWI